MGISEVGDKINSREGCLGELGVNLGEQIGRIDDEKNGD